MAGVNKIHELNCCHICITILILYWRYIFHTGMTRKIERVFITIILGLAFWALYIAFSDCVTGFQELWHMLG